MSVYPATVTALAVVLGGGLGIGVCLVLAVAPRFGAPTLARRIAPYIRDVTDPAGIAPPPSLAIGDVRAMWAALQARVGAALGGSDTIARRLQQAAWPMDVAAFRGRQLAWALVGLAIGGVVAVALALTGRLNAAGVLLPPVFAAASALLCDFHLSRAATSRVARITEELPTVLEFLALCLAAGEGILDSLRRVGNVGAGDLTAELRDVVVAVGTGSTLSDSLTRFAHRLQINALTRSIDHIVAAIDRGAPLAAVLQSQALDAREDAKRGLIEQAGRREVLMLIPLVFGVLPLSVLFAIFPGVFMLRLGIG